MQCCYTHTHTHNRALSLLLAVLLLTLAACSSTVQTDLTGQTPGQISPASQSSQLSEPSLKELPDHGPERAAWLLDADARYQAIVVHSINNGIPAELGYHIEEGDLEFYDVYLTQSADTSIMEANYGCDLVVRYKCYFDDNEWGYATDSCMSYLFYKFDSYEDKINALTLTLMFGVRSCEQFFDDLMTGYQNGYIPTLEDLIFDNAHDPDNDPHIQSRFNECVRFTADDLAAYIDELNAMEN